MSCKNFEEYPKMKQTPAFKGLAENETFQWISSGDVQVIVAVLTLLISFLTYFKRSK